MPFSPVPAPAPAPSPLSSRTLSPLSSRAPSPPHPRTLSPPHPRTLSPLSSRAPSPPHPRAPSPLNSRRGVGGQAAVELVAVLPVLALVLAAGYQSVVAGEAVWEAHAAARAAARASSFGADAAQAARAHLPQRLERGLRVRAESAGDVRVSLRVPEVIPAVRLGRVAATAHFQPQGG